MPGTGATAMMKKARFLLSQNLLFSEEEVNDRQVIK